MLKIEVFFHGFSLQNEFGFKDISNDLLFLPWDDFVKMQKTAFTPVGGILSPLPGMSDEACGVILYKNPSPLL
jgi:hypothetical protein